MKSIKSPLALLLLGILAVLPARAQQTFDVEFSVDMSVAILGGDFDVDNDVVTVAGSFNGWTNTADTLAADFFNPELYTKLIAFDAPSPPDTLFFKFVVRGPNDKENWEGVSDRVLILTGSEPDADGNGNPDASFSAFLNDVTLDDVFSVDTEVVIELDARPAFYFLADSTYLPGDTQTGDPVSAINGFYANGPFASPNGWEDWGPENLGAIASLELVDDGTKGDAVAGDSVYTFTLSKRAGQSRSGAMKFGVDGYDNESGFGGDHRTLIDEANPTLRLAFGATLLADGTFDDDNGPTAGRPQYDPYIAINNDAATPFWRIVRRGGETEIQTVDAEVEFMVDMSVAILGGDFDPDNDVVTVAGSLNGWDNTADTLSADFFNPTVYSKIIEFDGIETPYDVFFKFVVRGPNDKENWEGVSDRKLTITGTETDTDGNGKLDVSFSAFLNDVTLDDVFSVDTEVVIELDARPAFYFLADSTYLPGDTQTGDPVSAINGFYANGPFASPNGWEDWGPENLGAIASLELVDDGTKGDAVAGDSVYTFTLSKRAGQSRSGAMKFGVDGYDNESGFGGDHRTLIDEANPTLRLAFGATLLADGTFDDDNGPTAGRPQYDPYIAINNDAATPFWRIVRRGGETEIQTVDAEVEFMVDMSVAILGGDFDPDNDVVTVAGSLNGWDNTADTLSADFFNPTVYSKIIEFDGIETPYDVFFKFVVRGPNDKENWEGVSDRKLTITGTETDTDGNGKLDVSFSAFLNDVTLDDVFSVDTEVVIELDARPAFYFLADSTYLPGDTQTGDPVSAINGFYANGPFASPNGWEDWGPENLGAIASLELVDDGTKGDAVAGDSVYTFTLSKRAGQSRSGAMKFGVDGYDNESGFGGDHRTLIDEANPTLRLAFGATLLADGTFDDDNGPTAGRPQYDPYIAINNDATPPSFTIVRRGGEEEGTTDIEILGGELPRTAVLHQNYPNPFNPVTTIQFDLANSGNVRLEVFDMMGRRVALLADGPRAAARYSVSFDASGLASGTYVYRLRAPQQTITKTMVLLK